MKKYAFLTTLLAIVLFTACNKDKDSEKATNDTVDTNTQAAAENESTMEREGQNVTNWSMEQLEGADQGKTTGDIEWTLPSGAVVTWDTTGALKGMEIDFGGQGVLCRDGRFRKGKITTTWNGRYRDAGTVITHRTSGYFVNNNHIVIHRTVTNEGLDNDNHIYFTIEHDDKIIFDEDNTKATRTGSRVRTWLEGSETRMLRDDVYRVTGSGSGTNRNGHNWTKTIVDPLIIKLACRYIFSGSIMVEPEGREPVTIEIEEGCIPGKFMRFRFRHFVMRVRMGII